jgi:hypothetical protein
MTTEARMNEQSPIRGRWAIWECPECGFYDADPILRRGPGTRHSPMRCLPCGKRAIEALDLSRIARSHHEHYKHEARESAPVMVPRRGGPVPDEQAIERGVDALMADSGLPRFGPHRVAVERRFRLGLAAALEQPDAGP